MSAHAQLTSLMPCLQARLRILHKCQVKEVSVKLRSPRRLIPVHINNAPPSYYILGGALLGFSWLPAHQLCIAPTSTSWEVGGALLKVCSGDRIYSTGPSIHAHGVLSISLSFC